MNAKLIEFLNSLKVGDRVIVPKSAVGLIKHHAIYLGFWSNHHWFIENKEGKGVQVVTAQEFFQDVEKVLEVIKFTPSWNYSREELKQYALTFKGRSYHLFNFNCEHVANLIQTGEKRSRQVEIFSGFVALAAIGFFFYLAFANNGRKK